MRVAEIPSAMQWWIFIRIAQRLPFRPSMTQHSHSGRSRSSRRSSTSATTRNSSAVVAGPRDCRPAHVTAEVESRIVDPLWRTDIEGLGAQHLRASRYRSDPFCQNIFKFVIIGYGTVDDRDAADRQTDVPVRILRHEEARIERIELLHDSSPPFHCWGSSSSISDDRDREVAARLIRVNNWGRLCGNVVGVRPIVLCEAISVDQAMMGYSGRTIDAIEHIFDRLAGWVGAMGRRAGRRWSGCSPVNRAVPARQLCGDRQMKLHGLASA